MKSVLLLMSVVLGLCIVESVEARPRQPVVVNGGEVVTQVTRRGPLGFRRETITTVGAGVPVASFRAPAAFRAPVGRVEAFVAPPVFFSRQPRFIRLADGTLLQVQ